MMDVQQTTINAVRILSAEAIQKAKSGHPGLPMGSAPIGYALFQNFLKFNPRDPKWEDRDRFILSAGHGSMLDYSLLYLYGYDLKKEDLMNFRQLDSKTPGHPEYGHTVGIETTTGPLGQGIANAVGMAVLTVIGQCLGAGEKEQAKHYARRFLLVAYAGAWIMNLSAFFFLNRITLSWFNLSPESNAMALQVMVWFNIISLFIWPSSFTLPNILRAAGDATFTMTVSVFSMWVFRVGFCYLMVLGLHQGNLLSIWGGMFLDWLFRSLFFAIRFFKGSWLEKKVI